jgi:transcriptional regulator with XRE-family HTH domain
MMAEKLRKEAPGLVEQLRDAIRNSGQSLNQLSALCGVGRDRLSRFLRGERGLTLEAAEKICAVLCLELAPQRSPGKQEAPQEALGGTGGEDAGADQRAAGSPGGDKGKAESVKRRRRSSKEQ